MSKFIIEEGNGNQLQYSCLENYMDRGAWRSIIHGVTKSQTRLSDSLSQTCYFLFPQLMTVFGSFTIKLND